MQNVVDPLLRAQHEAYNDGFLGPRRVISDHTRSRMESKRTSKAAQDRLKEQLLTITEHTTERERYRIIN